MPLLEELRKNNKRTKRRPASQIRVSEGNNLDNNVETPSKVIRVEVKSDEKLSNKLGKHCLEKNTKFNSLLFSFDSNTLSIFITAVQNNQIKGHISESDSEFSSSECPETDTQSSSSDTSTSLSDRHIRRLGNI